MHGIAWLDVKKSVRDLIINFNEYTFVQVCYINLQYCAIDQLIIFGNIPRPEKTDVHVLIHGLYTNMHIPVKYYSS